MDSLLIEILYEGSKNRPNAGNLGLTTEDSQTLKGEEVSALFHKKSMSLEA